MKRRTTTDHCAVVSRCTTQNEVADSTLLKQSADSDVQPSSKKQKPNEDDLVAKLTAVIDSRLRKQKEEFDRMLHESLKKHLKEMDEKINDELGRQDAVGTTSIDLRAVLTEKGNSALASSDSFLRSWIVFGENLQDHFTEDFKKQIQQNLSATENKLKDAVQLVKKKIKEFWSSEKRELFMNVTNCAPIVDFFSQEATESVPNDEHELVHDVYSILELMRLAHRIKPITRVAESELLFEANYVSRVIDAFFVGSNVLSLHRAVALSSITPGRTSIASNIEAYKPDISITSCADPLILIVGEVKPTSIPSHQEPLPTQSNKSDLLKLGKICRYELAYRSRNTLPGTVFAVEIIGFTVSIYLCEVLPYHCDGVPANRLCLFTKLFSGSALTEPKEVAANVIAMRRLCLENLKLPPRNPNDVSIASSAETSIEAQPASCSTTGNQANNHASSCIQAGRAGQQEQYDRADRLRKSNLSIDLSAQLLILPVYLYTSSYSDVARAQWRGSENVDFVVKFIHDFDCGMRELCILQQASTASRVIRPLGCFSTSTGSLAIVFPRYTKIPDRLTGKQFMTIAHHLMEALSSLHSLNIIHRDIKPDNILLTNDGQGAVLIDFSLAVTALSLRSVLDDYSEAERASKFVEPFDFPGTLQFAAPEIRNAYFRGSIGTMAKITTSVCDIWSAAITLLHLLSWSKLLGQRDLDDIDRYLYALGTDDPLMSFDPTEEIIMARQDGDTNKLLSRLIPILSAMLRLQPCDRPSAEDVRQQLAHIDNDFVV